MAYRLEDTDLIFDGFEKGIGESPELGIADIRSMNITSVPSETAVNFSLQGVTLPPVVTSIAFTVVASSDIFTVASTTNWYTGIAIIINTLSGGTGISAATGSNVYYAYNITSTTFQLSKSLAFLNNPVNVTLDGSGTLSTAQFGSPVDSVLGAGGSTSTAANGQVYQNAYILDDLGQVWILGNGQSQTQGLNVLQFCGNTNHSTTSAAGGYGIVIWKSYLFVFLGNKIDYISLASLLGNGPFGAWHIGWKTITSSAAGHKALAATDDAVYFCNGSAVGSFLLVAGATFDPTDATTFTFNTSALALPTFDFAVCIAQLGTSLLVGGILTFVYPWNRTSTSFNYPLIVAEAFVKNIVSTNSNAYIFAGNRGNIYITNGANIDIYKKFPDHLSGTETPYYNWGAALYFRNQLYFSVSATTNAAAAINTFAGVWAYDLKTNALRLENSLSTASYSGTVPVIVPMGGIPSAGNGIYVGYVQTTGFIDYSSSNPYTNFESYIDTELVPVGTFYTPKTYEQAEFKLSAPLVTGEQVRMAYRTNLSANFATIFTTTAAGTISNGNSPNFEKVQWIQFRLSLASTVSSPSYNRLKEARIR